MTRASRTDERRRRRGFVLSMELVLVLPVLLVLVIAAVEFSILCQARGNVVDACRVGARLASQPGVREEEVADRVRSVLEPHLRNVSSIHVDSGEHAGDVVTVAVRVPMQHAAPDLLWPVGIPLRGRHLEAASRTVHE